MLLVSSLPCRAMCCNPACTRSRTQALGHMGCSASAPLAAGLLYQLSLDEPAKALFLFVPGALQRLHDSLLRALGAGKAHGGGGGEQGFGGFARSLAVAGGPGGPGLRGVPELVALAVNLAHSRRTAEVRVRRHKGALQASGDSACVPCLRASCRPSAAHRVMPHQGVPLHACLRACMPPVVLHWRAPGAPGSRLPWLSG